MYGEADCQTQAIPPGYNKPRMLGAETAKQETELSSILSTLLTQAREIRGIAVGMYDRITLRCDNECGEAQAFGGTYLSRAEEVRSLQRETINLLTELSKFA